MNIQAQIRKARAFRKMHDRTNILVLPNAWDAVTARLFARLGFAAVATTSGGVAWSLGYADGEHAPLDEVVAASARIAHAVDLPVSVDMKAGYGATPEAVAGAVRVGTATRFATLTLSAVERAAKELRASGGFECLETALIHPDVQRFFEGV